MAAEVSTPVLYIIVPCYNEEAVLPMTARDLFEKKLIELIGNGEVSSGSRILFVDDGSRDHTWQLIRQYSEESRLIRGVLLSRNQGHQKALLAGMNEAMDHCDIAVTMDCDGQDDISAIDEMIRAYRDGCDIVYGVRSDRRKDSAFKRRSAERYYKMLKRLGVETVYNHADYRLMTNRVLHELNRYEETNLYLRGIIPLIGFKSTTVLYERNSRIAGETHYPLRKMLGLGLDGVTSFSTKPLRMIMGLGMVVAFFSFVGVIWTIISSICGITVAGWASMTCIICFIGGIQLISIGVLGEYVGKIYMETKHRPRWVISERTNEEIAEKSNEE